MDLKSEDYGTKVYVFMMYFQSFLILLPFAFWFKWTSTFKLCLLWFGISVIPLFIFASYLETRFFSIGLLPAAVIIHQGVLNFNSLIRVNKNVLTLCLLIPIVIINRQLFTPISLYDIDQRELKTIVADVYKHEPDATIISPWVTEYCFLRFVHPDKKIRTSVSSLTGTGNNDYLKTPSFQWWIGDNNHVPTLEKLTKESKPLIYIGRSFSPAREKLYQYMSMLGMSSFMQRNVGSDRMSLSWMWSYRDLLLQLIQKQGPYDAYRVEFAPK